MASAVKLLGGSAGVKALSVDQFFDYLQDMAEGDSSAPVLYKKVAWVYRCTTLRADNVAKIPYRLMRGDTDLTENWPYDLRELLRTTESDLCLAGTGYWLKKGDTDMGVEGLQRLNPWTIEVLTDPVPQEGLTKDVDGIYGFKQDTGKGKPKYFKREQIVYFDHLYNPTDDLGPGTAPTEVCGVPAKLVHNMNDWASNFFEHGAVPLTVLETEGTIKEFEQKRIRDFWNKLTAGVKKAWRTVVLQKGMQAKVLGQAVKDLAMPDLDTRCKEQIANSYGVPMELLENTSGGINNTSSNDAWVRFTTDTIIPEADQIDAVIQRDLMDALEVEFEFIYNELEAIQKQEQQKAQGTSQILREINNSVTVGTLYQPEARALMDVMLSDMGLPSLEELVPKEELDAFIAEEERKEDEMRQQLQQPQQNAPPGGGEQSPKVFGAAPQALWSELALWKKTGRKHFDSDIIPSWFSGLIKASIDAVGQDAFLFLKRVGARRTIEARLSEAVDGVLGEYDDKAVEAVRQGGGFDYAEFSASLSAVLLPELQAIATQRVLEIAAEIGVQFDPAFINTQALEWARSYTFDLVSGLTSTTRGQISKAVQAFIDNPQMGVEDIAKMLESSFGPVRSEMIAVTEITRAYSQAQNFYQALLADYGIAMTRIWSTANDELVCIVCGPLEGAPEQEWSSKFPDGPPAHPRCRCDIELSARTLEDIDADFERRQRVRDEFLAGLLQ